MQNHLKTAREWGVQRALEDAGYKSAEEVVKEAQALGILEAPQPAASPLDALFRK